MSGQPLSRMIDRFLEVLAVILLGIATVGTAWCALQSQLWSREADRLENQTAAQRAESNRLYGLATQTISYDVTTVAGYAQAVASGNENLQEFFRASLVRAEFLDYLNTWEQQVLAGEAPRNLLDDDEYLDEVVTDLTVMTQVMRGGLSETTEAPWRTARVVDKRVVARDIAVVRLKNRQRNCLFAAHFFFRLRAA